MAPSSIDSAAQECVICGDQKELLFQTTHSKVFWGAGCAGAATKFGHVMITPIRHVAEISDLHQDEVLDLFHTIFAAARATYSGWFSASSWHVAGIGPKASCNVGFNFGPWGDDPLGGEPQEGRGGHLRVHVVPRNPNDTNFMWWTTRAAILHLRDAPARDETARQLQRLLGPGPTIPAAEPSAGPVPAGASKPGRPTLAASDVDFAGEEPSLDRCPLCREHDTLRANEHGRVLFSIKPYKFGAVMVIPHRHVPNLEMLTPQEAVSLASLVGEAAKVVCKATGTESYSVGMNIGPHSGASVPSHLHIHVVPRFPNDCSTQYWHSVDDKWGGPLKAPPVRELYLQKFGAPVYDHISKHYAPLNG